MLYHDVQYLKLVNDVIYNGTLKRDRTGTGTISVFGRDMRFDLENNTIPLLTTKKMHQPSIFHEILWYLSGDTNVKYLQENGVRIWNEWADENGDLGPVYGHQWRKWGSHKQYRYVPAEPESLFIEEESEGIDQIAYVIDKIKNDPDCRRMIVSAWNVGDLANMALPPCHAFFQFYVANNKLSCKLTQRSCDVGLGVPFNIAQYSILTLMVAQVTGMQPGEFVWSGGDVHIYTDHIEALKGQLEREPYPSPTLKLNPAIKDIDNFTFDDFEILNYEHHDAIKMRVSV